MTLYVMSPNFDVLIVIIKVLLAKNIAKTFCKEQYFYQCKSHSLLNLSIIVFGTTSFVKNYTLQVKGIAI